MGFISKLRARRAAKKGQDPSKANETVLANDDIDSIVNSSSSASCASNGDSGFKKKLKKLSSFAVTDVTMDHLPDLVLELETSRDTSSKQSGRALKMLFALSEPAASQTRIDMVAREEGRLVSALLNFLVRCSRKSSEQYLTLLVLNNISIPTESKRAVAMTFGGAKVLSELLFEDPSCHLIAIVLVNLTFADSQLRKELVSLESGTGLLESLTFALRIASLAPEDYAALKPSLEQANLQDLSPHEKLSVLVVEDEQRCSENRRSLDINNQMYSETARWCLTAMKNLSKPSDDSIVPQVLIRSKTVNIILQYITIPSEFLPDSPGSQGSDSSSDTPTPSEPSDAKPNVPSSWDPNSMQDAALYIVLNLCACEFSRDFARESDAVRILSLIADYQTLAPKKHLSLEEQYQLEFQCLKARMALSYLVGSCGHFGQSKIKSTSSTVKANPSDSVLVMTESEAERFVELLADSLHHRGKEGAGGYSATTLSVKSVLFALRCLMVHTVNQKLMVQVAGRILNSLLAKALALHSTHPASGLDEEAAEYACFSLYLLSNYGFTFRQNPFLPSWLDDDNEEKSLSAKLLTSYLSMANITPAGKHAAEQLLLRLKHLTFEGDVMEILPREGECLTVSDLLFGDDVVAKLSLIQLGERIHGAKPREDIFDRPILRRRKPKDGNNEAPWDNQAYVSVFPSALQAVQQLSFGSLKVRHVGGIDDILIANNIAKSANGQRTESYNFMWSWEDLACEIQFNMKKRQRSFENGRATLFPGGSFSSNDTASSILSRLFACGSNDTTA